jgi:hypothetical protein
MKSSLWVRRILCVAAAGLLLAGVSGSSCAAPSDSDRDGVVDADDNCPQIPNADQIDSDGNGSGDACDPIDECPLQLVGITGFDHPELAGPLEWDELIPFEIKGGDGTVLYKAVLQDRVARSDATGTLIFELVIRDVEAGYSGSLEIVRHGGFAGYTLGLIEYRSDGPGVAAPDCASTSADGDAVTYRFRATPLTGTAYPYAMQLMTDATAFATHGQTVLRLTTGESVVVTTVAPSPVQP